MNLWTLWHNTDTYVHTHTVFTKCTKEAFRCSVRWCWWHLAGACRHPSAVSHKVPKIMRNSWQTHTVLYLKYSRRTEPNKTFPASLPVPEAIFFSLLYMALKHYSATPGVASVSFISAISCSFVLDHVLSVVYISKRFKMHSPSSFEKLSLGWSQSQSKAAHNQHHLPRAPVVTNKRCIFLSSPILQPFTNTCNCRSRGQGIYWQHNSLPQKYIKNYYESSIHKYFGSP